MTCQGLSHTAGVLCVVCLHLSLFVYVAYTHICFCLLEWLGPETGSANLSSFVFIRHSNLFLVDHLPIKAHIDKYA